MNLRRKALEDLKQWKRDGAHQALLVTGARQVGKTFLVRQFADECYESLIEVNLIERPDACAVLKGARDTAGLFMRLTAYATGEVVPGRTLIFIDEVQELPEIVTSLKFLVDSYGEEYDFALSGSLLGVELKDVRSLPVGYLRVIQMFPLDFEEFCWACGVPSPVVEEARQAFDELRPVDEAADGRLADTFHNYLVVGGMPAAVQAFVQSRNTQQVNRIQGDILTLYRHDIGKYAKDRARAVRRIFDLIPSELNTQGKRFIIGHVDGTSRFNRYENDFAWLADAGVALPVYNVDEPRYPLELSADASYFKLFMADVGLLACACGMDVVRDLLADRPDINYGSIYENYVAQELAAHGLCSPAPDMHLYYFRSRKLGELDFVAEWPRGRVLPIEVKSGKTYRRHNALDAVLNVENYGIGQAVVLHEGNVEVEGRVRYLPMYMTMFLCRGNGEPAAAWNKPAKG